MKRLTLCLLALSLLAGFSLGEKLKQVKEQQCDHYIRGARQVCVILKVKNEDQ